MLPHKYTALDLSNVPPAFNKQALTLACKYFYRIYNFPKILLDSVAFHAKIRAIDTHD